MATKSMAQRIALAMWRKNGEPEAVPGDPTSVGKSWYEDRAHDVLEAAEAMGYVLVKNERKVTRATAPVTAG